MPQDVPEGFPLDLPAMAPYILQVPDDNVSEVHPVRKKYCDVAGLDWFSGIHFFPLTT